MKMVEKMYPKVKNWKLETPSDSLHLHRFYESLGYMKTKEIKDKQSNMNGYVYEKRID